MSPEQIEALFLQQLAALPNPAGIPPASANPKLFEVGNELAKRIIEIMMRFGFVSPTIPTPPPSGPMASMDAADLRLEAAGLNVRDGKLLPRRFEPDDDEVA